MITPKQLSLLAAAVAAGGLFLAQPASALAAIAHPYSVNIGQGSVNTVQPIGHRRWYGYRGGWRGGWGYNRPWPRYGYYRPWGGYGYGYYRPYRAYYGYPAYGYGYGYPYYG